MMTQEEREKRIEEKNTWIQENPQLNELMWAVSRTTGEYARATPDRTDITRGGKPEEELYQNVTDRDNNIYNLGVEAGALGMLDHLVENGYHVIDPNGFELKHEPAIQCKDDSGNVVHEVKETTFTDTYFNFHWGSVNT